MKNLVENHIKVFKEIEENYKVEDIKYYNIPLWPFLRLSYYFSIFEEKKVKKTLNNSIKIYLNYIFDFIFSMLNIFKKAENIIFSDYLEKRIIGNQLIDKICNGLPKENTIIFEIPPKIDYKLYRKLNFPHVSTLPIYLIARFFSYILKYFIDISKIQNYGILNEIEFRINIRLDIRYLLSQYLIFKKIFYMIFKIKKPSMIFINCSYSLANAAAIEAANDLGIKTIELQHGLINENHLAYIHLKKIKYNCFPKFFFSFGDYFTKIIKENYPIDPNYVFTIGNYYIEFMKNYNNIKLKEKIEIFKKTYKKIIVVTSQYTIESELINFLENLATSLQDILFIFIPREKIRNYDFKSKNLILIDSLGNDIDFYQIVKHADFHSTVYSTCAFEAPIFGVPNILININNLSNFNLKFLCELNSTKIADTPKDYEKIIKEWVPPEKDKLSLSHSIFFADKYFENLYTALEKIKSM